MKALDFLFTFAFYFCTCFFFLLYLLSLLFSIIFSTHKHYKSDLKNSFGSSKVQETQLEEKPTRIRIEHETQQDIMEI